MKDPTHSVVRGLLTTQRGWFGFLVVLVTFALYAAVASYPFLAHDDNFFVTENDYVKQGLTRESFIWSWTATLGFYHPLTWLSLLLDATIFGVNPGAFHLTNLWLHIANTLLLFHFVKRATGETGKSLVIAGLFAWHPINVETVAWVSERKGLLAMLFALAIFNNFLWNDVWTFRGLGIEQRGWGARLIRLLKFNLICVAGIALSVLLLNVQVSFLKMNVYLANFLSIVAVSIWNFVMTLKCGWGRPSAKGTSG